MTNVLEIFQIADDLGFTVHKAKSVVIPTQTIVFVGFVVCSVKMTVRLPPEKCDDLIHLCKERKIIIRKFAQLIGKCVSVEPGVRYATLYYKLMEIERDEALKLHEGNLTSHFTYQRKVNCAFSGGLTILPLHFDLYVYHSLTGALNLIVLAWAGVVMILHMM